jgi:hypothetical protein
MDLAFEATQVLQSDDNYARNNLFLLVVQNLISQCFNILFFHNIFIPILCSDLNFISSATAP